MLAALQRAAISANDITPFHNALRIVSTSGEYPSGATVFAD
jgi:hypothetical protein